MAQNIFCKNQKSNSKDYDNNFDRIFQKEICYDCYWSQKYENHELGPIVVPVFIKCGKCQKDEKNRQDTGGGCSICGTAPCTNIEGTYWLCKPCEGEFR